MILDFLKAHPLENLNSERFCQFLTEQNQDPAPFLNFTEADLFRLLFSDLEKIIDSIEIEESLPLKDQFFDLLMQITDHYKNHQDTLRRIESELSPCNIKDCFYYGSRITQRLKERLNVSTVTVHKLPFIEDLALPSPLHEKTLMLLCLHFLKTWVKDDSPDFEKTMASFDNATSYIDIQS